MAAGEDSGEDEVDQFFLAEEDLVERRGQGAHVFAGGADFGFGGVFHAMVLF